jgi:hypothetical protein
MAETVVTLSGDETKLLNAMRKVLGVQDNMDGGFKKIKASSKDANDNAFKGIDKVVTGLGQWASGFATVSAAGAVVNSMLNDQVTIQKEALSVATEVAKAQQEAAKNLAGVAPEKISALLQKEVPKIAIEASFKDIAALTKALGSTSSIVGEDRAASAVTTAAKLERLTPENLQTTATSLGDLVKATGLNDAREAGALLLSAGSVARPEELGKLSLGAARAVNAGTLASPGQDKVAAAKESTALFAMLSSVDKSGESASTATVQLIAQLREMFKDRPDDPGTTIGRLKAVKSDASLKESFLGDLKGEAIFKPLFEALTDDASQQSKELATALETITTDVKVFDAALKTLEITPQQKTANALARAETSVEVQKFGDKSSFTTAAVADIAKAALENTGSTTFQKFQNSISKMTDFGFERSTMTPSRFAAVQLENLSQRKTELSGLARTPEIQDKIQTIDAAIQSINDLKQVQNTPREFQSPQLEEQNKSVKEQNEILRDISRKLDTGRPTTTLPPPPPVNSIRAQATSGSSQGIQP